MSVSLVMGVVAVVTLLLSLGFVLWARRQWLVVTVTGHSMSPTLHDGQRLVARRLRGDGYARSDIVVFLVPDEHLQEDSQDPDHRVKRIAAVAGDPVPEWAREALGADEHTRVPPGKVVVSGDNARSQDSRQLGYIDARAIVAVVRQ